MKKPSRVCFATDYSNELSFEITVVNHLCEIVDSPRSLAVFLLINNGEFQQYLDLTIDPGLYDSYDKFADDYLVTQVLSKSPNLPLDIDRKQVALSSFKEGEALCAKTNERWRSRRPDWSYDLEREIGLILGFESKDFYSVVESIFSGPMDFGPGATTSVRGEGSVRSDKYDDVVHLTTAVYPFFRSLFGDLYANHVKPTIVRGNKWSAVPKNAKTDRGICAEPDVNSSCQRKLGTFIRGRLRAFGIDLNDQSINQQLACQASVLGLCTIDLKMASDTMAYVPLLHVLPFQFFNLLDLFRSPSTEIEKGKFVELEKFSSMGNGYTFELESLLFYGVVRTVVPVSELKHCSVYGDDIIIPSKYAHEVIRRLSDLGFTVNSEKTFLAGRFFESCGTDWFDQLDARPFYLRGFLSTCSSFFTIDQDVDTSHHALNSYRLAVLNNISLYALRRGHGLYRDPRFFDLWKLVFKQLPSSWKKVRVPFDFPALSGIFTDSSELSNYDTISRDNSRGFYGFYKHKAFVTRPLSIRKRTLGRLLSAYHDVSSVQAWIDNPYLYEEQKEFTYGREPRRGYLMLPRVKTLSSFWTSGCKWLR
jgi:hypothetical protein